ncbi:assimilatory sulfite reductase (NADPH) flavoprotein subunit [Alteromonas sp. ASW11-36]|uniref:Sulfite reductase [NADPH] flavoprotein alpha-component n=1 Tax=Alteromonas arenosi TaxID=3055817 RepID=A0ABT7SZ14_9ALTE|nr:assimilatory sulfite reductase (NADPH) flavoprotein subunit [Alteromonas sp. ASW11-36]MDM7861430.1 assimilatory sulfite reductase (NADPH) flavoprotein subunit [Alteromonas sp. ASW11-36]
MSAQHPGVLSPEQWNLITQAIAPLNREQLTWVSGYLAGLAATGASAAPTGEQSSQTASGDTFTVMYGSQTGNAKGVATQLHSRLQAAGVNAVLVSMADYKPRQIKNETHLAIAVSTHGEGDAPDDAIEFHEFLASKKAPKLANLKYTVLGLGDTSYEFFCQTGKDFDQRLANLGATALAERVDCDVDYEAAANDWAEKVVAFAKSSMSAAANNVVPITEAAPTVASQYNKQNPFPSALLVAQKITGRDSVKDIQHIELSLEDSGLQYQPGDALGVWFKNDPALVEELLSLTQIDPTTVVSVKDESMTVSTALIEKLELTLSYPGFIKAYAAATELPKLQELLGQPAELRAYLAERQIIDIVRDFPAALDAQQLIDALRPLTPRLYSIASSQAEVEDEVHLTVAHVDYQFNEVRHQGGASGYLTTRLEEGQEVGVFIEKNDNFRLPQDGNTPVIMIGPGTGIAPFRAFMQEREATGADGDSWLFFGNPNFTQDFLYQTEWQAYLKSGALSRISLAFSRDQAEKIYVQHRIIEHGADVFAWLESGAHVYVCGDAMRMAKDVEEALLEVIKTHGKRDDAGAKEYLVNLRKTKRYQKDVY